VFSLDRFAPSAGGGRLPIQRYLSLALLNRITFFEFDQLRRKTMFPAIENKLTGDALYDAKIGSEPPRNLEVIQSWEAVKELNKRLVDPDRVNALKQCREAVKVAGMNYDAVQRLTRLDQKSNAEHIQPLADGLGLFAKLAEL
jgi:hypothetical protein